MKSASLLKWIPLGDIDGGVPVVDVQFIEAVDVDLQAAHEIVPVAGILGIGFMMIGQSVQHADRGLGGFAGRGADPVTRGCIRSASRL